MKQILIVDDVEADLQSAVEVLKDSYEVTARDSGRKALALLQDMQPDLILLDVNMPDMDGYDVMEELKKDRKLNEIPVIFLTSKSDQESEIKGLKMGAMDFVRKPFEPEVMRSRIDKILRLTEQNRELQKIALKDGLTDLLNRRYMEKLLNQTDINNEEKGYFLLFDLDNFKLVNDNFGHITGDDVLIKFARVLQEEVGPKDSVCRLGGDEFAVYVSGGHSRDEIKRMARRMIAGIEFEINDMLLDSCDVKVSVSIGIAEKPADGDEFTELYGAADKALYYVKQNGKRGYHFFHDGEIDYEKAEEDNNQINLLQLQRLVQERGRNSGAYIGGDGFKRIYHFVTRYMERKRQDVQLVLFSIQDAAGGSVENDMAKRGAATLERAVTQSLRRGDVATRCGTVQYVVILMNTSIENGELVANRICSKFAGLLGDGTMTLTYEIQNAGRAKLKHI